MEIVIGVFRSGFDLTTMDKSKLIYSKTALDTKEVSRGDTESILEWYESKLSEYRALGITIDLYYIPTEDYINGDWSNTGGAFDIEDEYTSRWIDGIDLF